MDKKKNNDIENNIDDVLKLLKNTYENKDNVPDLSLDKSGEMQLEDISPDALSERLRAQFMSGGEVVFEKEKGEYDFDEALMSEFLAEEKKTDSSVPVSEASQEEEAENVDEEIFEPVKEEPEEIAEQVEAEAIVETDETSHDDDADETVAELESEEEIEVETEVETETSHEEVSEHTFEEGEIVEIVIPFVEKLKARAEAKDTSPDDEEENDDFYDEENEGSENSYICFADENVSDEEILEQEKAEEEEEYSETEFSLEDIKEDDVSGDADDLPWYSDDELGFNKVVADEKKETTFASNVVLPLSDNENDQPLDTSDTFEELYEIQGEEQTDTNEELVSASFEEASAPVLELDDISQLDETETLDIAEKLVEDVKEDEPPVYKLFSDNAPRSQQTKEVEEDDTSFYRTIIEARTERENQYGYPKTEPDNVFEATQEGVAADEHKVLDGFEQAEPLYEEKATEETVTPYAVTTDYYGEGEQDEDPDEDIDRNEEGAGSSIEFEHETISESDLQEKEKSALLKLVKPILLGILALAIFVLEMMPILKIVPEGFFDYTSYPVPYILIDSQLLIFMVALCYEKLFDGLLKIVKPNANFYSLLSVTVIVTLMCSVISCFSASYDMPRMYNFISAAYLFMLCVIERVNRKREKTGDMMLDGKKVYGLRQSQGKNSTAEKMYLGGVDPDTDILEPVEIISDDFRSAFARERIDRNRNFYNTSIIGAIVPAAIFSMLMAVLSIVFERGLLVTVNSFAFSFVSVAPLCAIVSYYLPILVSNKRLSERECVIAGYESACEVADCDAFVFSDCHMFKECNAKEAGIKLYCDEIKTRELFVCLAAAYSKLGGPMQSTFSSVLGDRKPNVNMIRITRNGFEAVIDNRTNLIVGSSEYLLRYGIITDRADTKEAGIIYAAMNSVLCAKISVMYRTQPLFEALCDILEEYSIRAVIETYDPLISGKYVAKCRGETSHSISVVHKNVNDYNLPVKDKAHSSRIGVFAASSRLKLVEIISFCKRIKLLRKLNTGVLIGSYALAGLLCIGFVIGGAIENANLLWALLYQTALAAVYVFACIKLLPLSFDAMQEKKIRDEIKKQEKENRNQI